MDGVLLVDKPAGRTSHDVVNRVRRALRERADDGAAKPRVGHAGTLDPFATGLLLVLVGRATRVQRWLMDQPKEYETRVRFGWTSTTGDPEGELVETGRLPAEPLTLPTGWIRQRPPAYSAIKIGGQRAYARARRGEDVVVPEREVCVERFERTGPDTFAIRCSSGTYVRSLVADLGDAYCLALRRTAIGTFSVADAVAADALDLGAVVGLADVLAALLPVQPLDAARAADPIHGRPLALPGAADGEVVLADDDGPISIARVQGGVARTVVGFRAGEPGAHAPS